MISKKELIIVKLNKKIIKNKNGFFDEMKIQDKFINKFIKEDLKTDYEKIDKFFNLVFLFIHAKVK